MVSNSSNGDVNDRVPTSVPTNEVSSCDEPDKGAASASATAITTTVILANPESKHSLPPGLSKNRKKKLEKRERARQKKLERKASEKAKRLATAIAQDRDLSAEKKFVEERTLSGDRRRRLDEIWDSKRNEARAEGRFEICVDLGARRRYSNNNGNESRGFTEYGRMIRAVFEEAMREGEIASLARQVRYCYSCNKNSPNPVLASVTGLTARREISKGDDVNAFAFGSDFPTVRELLERETGFLEWNRRMFDCTERTLEEYYGLVIPTKEIAIGENHPERSLQQNIVYLTSDSPNTLERLEDKTVYVIGGIVDRNRLKRATIDRAEHELKVETAKLPLQEYLVANNISMTTTKVLTVNHVFDILLKYKEYGNNWDKAFGEVLPSRKV